MKVVIQEITASEIELKLESIQENPRLGQYFLTLVTFLEKASCSFSGFMYDINQMIIQTDIFMYMFDILEKFKYSDML